MILPIIVFVLLGIVVLSSVLVFKMSANAVSAVERAHERSNDYNRDLLDRLMATDFNTYKVYTRPEPETGYIAPEVSEEQPVLSRHGGFGSDLGLRAMGPEAFDTGDDEP